MAYKIRITDAAYCDLDEILDYMASKLQNKQAAIRFHDEFFKKIAPLATQPYLHEISRDQILRSRGYRKIAIESYIVLYTVDDVSSSVIISRVFYGPRKYEDLL